MAKKKYKAYIDALDPFRFVIEYNKSIVITNDKPYKSKGQARRIATQVASELKLDIDWVPQSTISIRKIDVPEHIEKLGIKVFESQGAFHRWLTEPCFALGGKVPLMLIESKEEQQVKDELLRIEYGVFA
jgi:Protein of unknown function (DUF2384)